MPEIFLPRIASHTLRGFLCAQSGKVPLPSSAATMLRHQRGRGAPLWTPPKADRGVGDNAAICTQSRHQAPLLATPRGSWLIGLIGLIGLIRQSQPKSPVLSTGYPATAPCRPTGTHAIICFWGSLAGACLSACGRIAVRRCSVPRKCRLCNPGWYGLFRLFPAVFRPRRSIGYSALC